jgi:hypothetical protein
VIFGQPTRPEFVAAPFHSFDFAVGLIGRCADLWPAGTVLPLYEPATTEYLARATPGDGGGPDDSPIRPATNQVTTSPTPDPRARPSPHPHTPDTADGGHPPATHPTSPARPGQPGM